MAALSPNKIAELAYRQINEFRMRNYSDPAGFAIHPRTRIDLMRDMQLDIRSPVYQPPGRVSEDRLFGIPLHVSPAVPEGTVIALPYDHVECSTLTWEETWNAYTGAMLEGETQYAATLLAELVDGGRSWRRLMDSASELAANLTRDPSAALRAYYLNEPPQLPISLIG